MLIDWFTVAAQVVNFLILVWLLKHFLYQPIIDAIDAREKRVAAELADADAKRAEALNERDEFRQKNEAFEQKRAALISQATGEAKAERQRLLGEARQASDELVARRLESLRHDTHNLNQAISRRTQQEVFAIARKALADLASASLEERMGEVFTRRLREMDGPAKESFASALKKAAEPAVLRSAFELPAEQRAALKNAVNEIFSADIHIRFETAPDVVSGIEFSTGGQKIAWSIADYLASLETAVNKLLETQARPGAKPEPEPEQARPETKTQ